MSLKTLPIYLLISLLAVFTPVQAWAADNAVGNEVLDAANTTLTRSGAGTAASPYRLQLNVGNANTWGPHHKHLMQRSTQQIHSISVTEEMQHHFLGQQLV